MSIIKLTTEQREALKKEIIAEYEAEQKKVKEEKGGPNIVAVTNVEKLREMIKPLKAYTPIFGFDGARGVAIVQGSYRYNSKFFTNFLYLDRSDAPLVHL